MTRVSPGRRAALAFLFAVAIAAIALPSMLHAQPIAPPAAAVAGASFNAETATRAYLDTMSPEARAKSNAYFEGGYWLLLWDLVVSLVVAWLMLGTRLSAGIRDRIEKIARWRWLQTMLYAVAYILVTSILTLPWAAYEGYAREHAYSMSNQTLGAWFGDQLKGLAIGVIMGSILLTVLYAVLRRAPRTWWLWGSLVTIGFAILAVAIAPVYLEPVFNKFQPLSEGPLKQQILATARANEIPATDVYQFDASKQTKRMSAHVSGLLGTTQISMNDNLLHRASNEEILAVLGHEMGHYVLHHVTKGITFVGIIIVAGFAFLRWSFARLQASHGARWGIRGIDDPAGLPLLIALFTVYMFVFTPVNNTITRTMEAEADNYGLNTSRQPDGFAQAALHLSEYRKMEPGPIEEWLFYDHPSGWHRIHRAMVWKAEHVHDADVAAYDTAHGGQPAPVAVASTP